MDWRLLEGWWEELRSRVRKAIRRDHEAEVERVNRDRADEKRKREEDDRADRMVTMVLLSAEHRRQFQQLFNDIDDASRATALAYQRAVRDAETAEAALDEAQRHALVLPDGRRAYFDAHGRLMLEDGLEITDPADCEAARRALDLKPDATSYEIYLEDTRRVDDTTARVAQIAEALQRLRDLKERIAAGSITPHELARARKDLDTEIRSMSPDMREDYERLRAARASEPADDPAASPPSILHTEFTRANQAFVAEANQSAVEADATSKPAYKNAPEF